LTIFHAQQVIDNKEVLKRLLLFCGFGLLVGVSVYALRAPQGIVSQTVPPMPQVLREKISSGTVTVSPDIGTAGEYGTWTVSYRVGQASILAGGGIRVELPEPWHAGVRNSANRLQTTAPAEPHYVTARCSKPEVGLQTTVEFQSEETLVKGVKPSNLSRRMGYYVFVVRVIVLKGEVHEGDTLSVVYGDQSHGSPGMRAAIIPTQQEPILVAVDTEGSGRFRLHVDTPKLTCHPGLPTEMLMTTRSEAIIGQPAILHLALLDRFGNRASAFTGDVILKVQSGQADIPFSARFDPNKGWAEVRFTPRRADLLRFEALEPTRNLSASSNPIEVHREPAAESLYWGDIHSHTRFSGADAVGRGEEAHEYARYVAGLDFYAMTDHSRSESPIRSGLTTADWGEYTRLTEQFYAPGQFATLHAYEASFYAPYGHHNIYFRGKPGPLLSPDAVTLPELWRVLEAGQALTIPHHTLKMPEPIDWREADDPELRRNFEIYSGHGLSEAYDPQHPLAFEQSLFTNPSHTTKAGMSAQKAWSEGYRLSTIASSDDHRAHPGQPHYGLVAVRSQALTREGIFDALFERQTYGTTGVRIILDFTINDVAMGKSVEVGDTASVRVRAVGTDVIDSVEVLRHVKGKTGFQVIHQVSPSDHTISVHFDDHPPKGKAIYYVRLRQRQLVRDRIAMAWSSPVWVSVN